MTEKSIKNLSIEIGHNPMYGQTAKDAIITFFINERLSSVKLKDLHGWIDTIWKSQGNRNEDAYEAFRKFESFFHELLHPFVDYKFEDLE